MSPISSGGDFSQGLPFFYVNPAGVLYARLDAEDPYLFMNQPVNLFGLTSIDMEARRQIKSVDSSFIPIIEQFMTGVAGFTGPTISNVYVYRSSFAKLYQATTISESGLIGFNPVEPPVFISADNLNEPTYGSQIVGGGTYYGYSMPAHTFWGVDTPLVLEFTDDGDGLVKYVTIQNIATPLNNSAYSTLN